MGSDSQSKEYSDKNKEKSAKESARERFRDPKNIEELRERLYIRGKKTEQMDRTKLTAEAKVVRQNWGGSDIVKKETPQRQDSQGRIEDVTPQAPPPKGTGVTPVALTDMLSKIVAHVKQKVQQVSPAADSSQIVSSEDSMKMRSKRNVYRKKIVLISILFFAFTVFLSFLFLWGGGNTISGSNISVDISPRPFTIGGGEELSLQVAVANQNSVPIESATLIVNYPPGTQSASELGKELFSERIQLNTIGTGEVVNIPVTAVMFGEENEEKTIMVAVEYRVSGSNAIFFKEAEPLRLKISSSPVTLRVENVGSISSGQEIEFDLTVESNSPTPISGILVKAAYPFGFEFDESSPETYAGQDTWYIDELSPEDTHTITIRGIVTGKQDEVRNFIFSVGVPNERDRFNLASMFSSITTEVAMEDPFLDINIDINGRPTEQVVIGLTETASVNIAFTNALSDIIYDAVVVAQLRGDAYDEVRVSANDGFYDSDSNTITWDAVDVSGLSEIAPQRSAFVQFQLSPLENISETPEILLDVTVSGKRVSRNRVPEELKGSASRTIRIESYVSLVSSGNYSTGPFPNSGPLPPTAGEVTQYTLTFEVQNGTNDITGAEMTAVLPQYITWLDLKTTGDTVTYSPSTRTLRWDIGDMKAKEKENASVQVSLKPSLAQVGTIPTLIGEQQFKATDRFTGTTLRATAPAFTTSLFNDPDSAAHDGQVVYSEDE